MKTFSGKNAVVTGTASGIGRHLAIELSRRGARVAHCDIANAKETCANMDPHPDGHYFETVDMGDRSGIDTFVDNVIKVFGSVDVLINNAGVALGDRTFEEVTPDDFQKITDVNYWGVVHTTQGFYPYLLKSKSGAIANLSSTQGILGAPFLVPYCTTKFAVRGFTDALRAEHHVRGIDHVSVHTVHPGAVATDIALNADYVGDNSRIFHKQLQKGTPPQEAARTILAGILKNKPRIFVSDGIVQDAIARMMPEKSPALIKLLLKFSPAKIR